MNSPPLPLAHPPAPPRKPEPQECCGTGCIPCVMDLYEEELWQYEKDLRAWQAQHPEQGAAIVNAEAAGAG